MPHKLSDILKEARADAGYVQKQVAHLLGVRRSTIGNYESGRSVPSLDRLYKLCAIYQIDFFHVASQLYETNYVALPCRERLQETISSQLSQLDTPALQHIEYLFSKRHNTPLQPILYMLHLITRLTPSQCIQTLEWLWGCYTLQNADTPLVSASAVQEAISLLSREKHIKKEQST